MNSETSILVASCSMYKNMWNPFFYLLKEYWEDCPFKIYLGSDKYTNNYSHKDHNITLLKTDIEPYASTYSDRVADFVGQINSKYVILFLEDHLIDEEVDTNEVLKCIEILEESKEEYKGIRLHAIDKDCGLGERKHRINNRININECSSSQPFWFSFQSTLWDREFLLKSLNSFSGNGIDCEREITNSMKKNNNKILALAHEDD